MTLENTILHMSDYIINLRTLVLLLELAKQIKWHCLLIF